MATELTLAAGECYDVKEDLEYVERALDDYDRINARWCRFTVHMEDALDDDFDGAPIMLRVDQIVAYAPCPY